jgi:hypothetical protein
VYPRLRRHSGSLLRTSSLSPPGTCTSRRVWRSVFSRSDPRTATRGAAAIPRPRDSINTCRPARPAPASASVTRAGRPGSLTHLQEVPRAVLRSPTTPRRLTAAQRALTGLWTRPRSPETAQMNTAGSTPRLPWRMFAKTRPIDCPGVWADQAASRTHDCREV